MFRLSVAHRLIGPALALLLGAAFACALSFHPVAALAEEPALVAVATDMTAQIDMTAQASESEPNNEWSSATRIPMKEWIAGISTSADDYDWYVLNVPQAGRYSLSFAADTQIGNSYGYWRVTVYDFDRNEVLSKNHGGTDLGRDEWTEYLPEGAAYIWVSNGYDISPGASYRLRVAEEGFAPADSTDFSGFARSDGSESEPNDTIQKASLIGTGSYVTGATTTSGDSDFYVVNVARAGRYSLSFAADTQIGNSYGYWRVTVYDFDRNEVLSKNHGGTDLGRDEWTEYLPEGAAYIWVSNGYDISPGASYRLRVDGALMEDAVISVPAEVAYTGSALTPKVSVRVAGRTLEEGVDYTATYSDNVGTGTATVTVTGKGDYTGSKSATFKVNAASIATATVTLSPTSYAYDGRAKQPSVTVRLGSATLRQGADYDVSYSDNTNVGTATATVTGKGNYAGTARATFAIAAAQTSGGTSGSGNGGSAGGAPGSSGASQPAQPTVQPQAMHRLYNPHSGEHFYTADEGERDAVAAAGWKYEGVGWTAPATSNTPVYRLYNKHGGEHHYCTDKGERDALIGIGWLDEGVGWYSDDAKAVPLYREYNPNAFANNHNYTTSKEEHEWLLSLGWKDEGRAWYGVK